MTIPFRETEFLVGAGLGLCASLIGVAAALIAQRWRPLPIAGLLFGVAGVVALGQAARLRPNLVLPEGLVVGLAALAAAGVIADILRAPPLLAWLLALPGALEIVRRGELVDVRWVRYLAVAIAVLGGSVLADFDRRWRRTGATPVLVAVSAVGLFYTLPDVEEAMVFLGVALGIALLGWPWPLASLGRPGSFVVAGFLAWTVVAGGYGRQSSIIGGAACLGLLVVEPLARTIGLAFRGRQVATLVGHVRRSNVPAAVLLHLGLVYVASRVAGLRTTVAPAAVIALIEGIVATVFVAWLMLRRTRTCFSPNATHDRRPEVLPERGMRP